MRTAATLLVATAVLVVGLVLGFRLLTRSADTAVATPTCTNRTVDKGEELTSNLVTVNVYNDSNRSGLANRVEIDMQRKGFLGGTIANSTSSAHPKGVAILTDDRTDPRVRLVAAQFNNRVKYAKPDIAVEEGVAIVVGDDYTRLKKKASRSIKADRPVTVCVPIVKLP